MIGRVVIGDQLSQHRDEDVDRVRRVPSWFDSPRPRNA